jgi:internalin A
LPYGAFLGKIGKFYDTTSNPDFDLLPGEPSTEGTASRLPTIRELLGVSDMSRPIHHAIFTLVFSICTSLTLTGAPLRAVEVAVPDENLAKVLKEKLEQKQIKKDKFESEDLATIYILHANDRQIKDLTGLEHCVNLAEVRLAKNQIENVAPLSACKNIQSLDLAHNNIQDISPLGGLVKLQYLNIEHNQVVSLSAAESLKALASLYADHNKIQCLAPVIDLPRLFTLHASHNEIKDLHPVASLTRLTSLGVAHNQICDVHPLTELHDLNWTFLQGNQIRNIAPLVTMAQQDAAGEQRFAPFWNLYLGDNPVPEDVRDGQYEALRQAGVRLNIEANVP